MAREGVGAAQQEPGKEHQGRGRRDHAAQGQAEGSPAQTDVER